MPQRKVRSYKGIFTPQNPSKYKGDYRKIVFRSLWERKVMKNFDSDPNVIQWSSEEIIIPYISPVDGRAHRYFPDFYVKFKAKDGSIQQWIIEVKPHKQTLEPERKKKITKGYITEVVTYAVNLAKWDAAENYCKDRGFQFQKLTEYDLFNSKHK